MAGNIAAFKALADENRMLILRLLLRRNCCARALARQLDISEAAVSQHLKVLREAGLDRKSTRLNSSHRSLSRMPSSA